MTASSFATGAVHVTFNSGANSVGAVGNMECFTGGSWFAVTAWNAAGTTLNLTACGAGNIATVTAVRITGPLNVVFANGLGNNPSEQIVST